MNPQGSSKGSDIVAWLACWGRSLQYQWQSCIAHPLPDTFSFFGVKFRHIPVLLLLLLSMIVKQFLLGFIDLSNVLKNRQNFSIPSSCSSFGRFLATLTSWWLSGSVWQLAIFGFWAVRWTFYPGSKNQKTPSCSCEAGLSQLYPCVFQVPPIECPLQYHLFLELLALVHSQYTEMHLFHWLSKHWWRTRHKRGARRSNWLIQTLACQTSSRLELFQPKNLSK